MRSPPFKENNTMSVRMKSSLLTLSVASGVTKGLAMVSALGGVSATSTDITRYDVEVNPEQFSQVSRKYMDGFMDMLFISANNARAGK
jgi:hypothetical protein